MSSRKISIELAGIFIALIIVGHADAKLDCSKVRSIYRCIASDRDEAHKFMGTVKNIHSSDIIIDVMNIVDTCEKIRNPPMRPMRNNTETQRQPRGGGPTSRTALVIKKDFDIKIKKGGEQMLSMERVKAVGYCSKSIISNCRTASSERKDCSQLISIS